jgi:hypothetical protein
MGVWRDRERERERERERKRVGWGGGRGAGRARSMPEVHPDSSHGTKMLGKAPITKKAHEKSLMSNSKV